MAPQITTNPNPNPDLNPHLNTNPSPNCNSAMPFHPSEVKKIIQYLSSQLICDDLWCLGGPFIDR